MLARSFSLVDIVEAQAGYPFYLVQPVALVIFFISAVAESKRIPFDLPEAEGELVAGYHLEYSGMRFGLYFLGEYITTDRPGRIGGRLLFGRMAAARCCRRWSGF